MVGDVAVGGGAPISVQSMTNTDTADVESTVAQVAALARVGETDPQVRAECPEISTLGPLDEEQGRAGRWLHGHLADRHGVQSAQEVNAHAQQYGRRRRPSRCLSPSR